METTDNRDILRPDRFRNGLKSDFSVNNPLPETDFKLFKDNYGRDGNLLCTTPVASSGELVMVYGPEKSRKSTLSKAIVASAYNTDRKSTFGFSWDMGDDEYILHYCTEMGKVRYHSRMTKFNRICGGNGKEDLPYFHSRRLKGFNDPLKKVLEIESELEYLTNAGEKVGVVLIDQVADLVSDINDRRAVNDFILTFEQWQEMTGAIFICVMHTTLESKRATGIQGRELQKKMDTGIYCEKRSSGITYVENILAREDEFFNFKFNHNDMGYPELVLPEDLSYD